VGWDAGYWVDSVVAVPKLQYEYSYRNNVAAVEGSSIQYSKGHGVLGGTGAKTVRNVEQLSSNGIAARHKENVAIS
jgi:hypothetical protein